MQKSGLKKGLRLLIGTNNNLPPFLFVNVNFDITIYLFDENEQLYQGTRTIPLIVKLMFDDVNAPAKTMSIMSTTVLGKDGTCKLVFKMNETSLENDNRKFVLFVGVDRDAGNLSEEIDSIFPVVSSPFMSVTHKLVLEEEYKEPFAWYKDEGGKDKGIQVKVSLRDGHNNLVKNRYPVPLKLILCYAGGKEVNDQKLLTVSPDSKLFIGCNGDGHFRYRVEAVSKSHQSFSFCVLVLPDPQNSKNLDIAPTMSMEVNVRSKRNKKKEDEIVNPSKIIRRSIMTPSVHGLDSADVNAMEVLNGMNGRNTMPIMAPVDHYPVDSHAAAAFSDHNPVVGWVSATLEQLEKMRWRPVGYDVADPGRLLYSMQNPNDIIDSIFQSFYTNVRPCLGSLSFRGNDHTDQDFAGNCSKINDAGCEMSRYNSLGFTSALFGSSRAPATEASVPVKVSPMNEQVEYLLSTPYYSKQMDLMSSDIDGFVGMPAYDSGKHLIGFYRSDTGDHLGVSVTQWTFLVAVLPGMLAPDFECVSLTIEEKNELEALVSNDKSHLYSVGQYKSEGRDKEDLLEDIFKEFWANSV